MVYFTKRLLLFMLASFFCLFSFGQEKKQFSGPLQLGSIQGKASYQYFLKDADTILDGPFKIQNANLGALIEKSDASIAIAGAYKNGQAQGPWSFQFGQYESNSESALVGFEYRVLISGRQEQGSGSFVGGKPDGQWKYSIDIIKDSEVEKNLFKSNINFKGGIPQQSFQLENQNTSLVGRTLRNGMAHDTWESYDSKVIENTESWVFNEGILEKIVLVVDGVITELPVFTSTADYKSVDLNNAYLQLLELVLPVDQSSVINKGVGALLKENEDYYQKMDSLLNHLGKASLKVGIQVKVPEYPLDSIAKQHLASFQKEYTQGQKIADELLQNSHLNIIKRSDADAFYHFQVVEQINKDYLTPLKTVNDLVELDLIANISFERLFERLYRGQMPKDEISVTIDSLDNTKIFRLENEKSTTLRICRHRHFINLRNSLI